MQFWSREKKTKQNVHSPLKKKGNKNRHVNNILFSSKNELAIRHTIQLHRYIFSIPHIQSAKKKKEVMITKPNKDAAIYIERCMYNDYSVHNCTMPQ